MKITFKFLRLILLLTLSQVVFGQNQEKIFYDKDGKGTSQGNCSFYRIVTYEGNSGQIRNVKDYFVTGELQGEGEAISIDKEDDSKSKWKNKCITYYKSGKKQSELFLDSLGNRSGTNTSWYENGTKQKETNYLNNLPHGFYITYFENGKLKVKIEFENGKRIGRWYVECDEFENCQRVFYEGFKTEEDVNNWNVFNKDGFNSEIISGQGLLMVNKSDKGVANWIYLPIDISSNFSINTRVEFKGGNNMGPFGLIYGFKDWNNLYYFFINANGFFQTGAISDGIKVEYSKWTESKFINKSINDNTLQINKVKDKVYFSINRQIVASEDFYLFKGNNIGICTSSGPVEIQCKEIVVKEDIMGTGGLSPSSANAKWKGNGSGFFIDAKGYIATNYHVIENAEEIEIDLIQKGQKKSYKAKVISSDKQNDLAIIKIDDVSFKRYLRLPYSFKTQICDIGSSIFTLGYPMALSGMGDEVKFTDGKISSKTGFKGDITTYQISVPVQPGNSGGPLFNYDGNIIGVVSAKIIEADNVAYAIKSSYLKNLLDVLPENINIPDDQTLSTKPLTEKIKLLSDYVVLIKIR